MDFFVVGFFFLLTVFLMFPVSEKGSSIRGRGISESGLYWIIKSEPLSACIIFSPVPMSSGDLKNSHISSEFFSLLYFVLDLGHSCLSHLSVAKGRSMICQGALWAAMIFLVVAK